VLPSSSFARQIITVAGGTVIAQAIPVLASPLLTRLYAPAEFGSLALYLSLVAVGAIAATGRYELAILLPADQKEARALTQLTLSVSAAATVLFFAVAVCVYLGWIVVPAWRPLGATILLVPIGILLTACYQTLGYWLNRHTRYKVLASSRIAQSAGMLGTQLGAGAANPIGATLIFGHLVGQITGIVTQVWRGMQSAELRLGPVDRSGVRRAAVSYARYPKYLVVGHVANALSSQLPVLLLAALFSPAVAGLYALAERVLVLPSSVIGSAIGDVYRQRAAAEYQQHGNCRALYVRTLRQLIALSVLPCVTIMSFGPRLFRLAFGTLWESAGSVASILAGMVFFQMISSPLSQTVYLAGMHRLDTAWQFARLAAATTAILAGARMSPDPETAVTFYAISFATMHLLHSAMQYHASRGTASAQ
jgi:O-antigen/teichoic acid export membrane protein